MLQTEEVQKSPRQPKLLGEVVRVNPDSPTTNLSNKNKIQTKNFSKQQFLKKIKQDSESLSLCTATLSLPAGSLYRPQGGMALSEGCFKERAI